MYRPWYESESGSQQQSVQSVVRVPIFGENFSTQLLTAGSRSLTRTKAGPGIRVLNVPKLKNYEYGKDPESLDVLFDREKNSNEALKENRFEAYADLVERLTVIVPLQNVLVHTFPDHELFEVLVVLRTSRVVKETDTCFLIPKRGVSDFDLNKARRGLIEDLKI